jgi:hypothetical protein
MTAIIRNRAIFAMLFASLVFVAGLPQQLAHATVFSSDYSDLWWNPSESGWGIQFVQQDSIIFATMFVYGPSGQPVWYSATMPATTTALTFAGALYVNQGSYFGTTPFNSASVTNREVGTMTVNFPSLGTATLTYAVDGTNVTKQILRQTLTSQSFNGSFVGSLNANLVSGDCHLHALDRGKTFATTITHDRGTTIAMNFATADDSCSMPAGAYSQMGHFGNIQGNVTCRGGDTGSIHIFEGDIASDTVTARYTFTSTATSCIYEGAFAGVRL